MRVAVALFLAVGAAVSAMAQERKATLTGVASVADGDGPLFGRAEVRLQGIAAPELDGPTGAESRAGLLRLAGGKEVVCHLDGTTAGRSRCPVAVCFVDGRDVGRAQVEAGLARDCPGYSKGRYRDASTGSVAQIA